MSERSGEITEASVRAHGGLDQNPMVQRDQNERTRRTVEIIPGKSVDFTPTGLDGDVRNLYTAGVGLARYGKFDMLKPLRTYEEYLRDQDRKYQETGITGYAEAVIKKGKEIADETGAGYGVPAFNALVDEYNENLDAIKRDEDIDTVEAFIIRFQEIEMKLPDEVNENSEISNADAH